MAEEKANILVVGSGAIGAFYAGKLVQSGAKVDLLCRSDYETIKSKGVLVKSIWGDFHYTPRKTIPFDKPDPGEYDYVILCTKVLPGVNVPSMIRPFVSKETSIVLIQNGIEIEPPIAKAFPDNEILSGLAFVCCERKAPGEIYHTDYGRLVIGLYPRGYSSSATQLVELFRSSGVPAEVTEDVKTARWAKLVWNAPFNPISVLCKCTTDKMVSNATIESVVRAVMKEVVTLARLDGSPLSFSIIESHIKDTKVMKPYKTSMLLDYEAGRPMEIEAILGNAVRKAEEFGIEVPHLKTLYGVLSIVEQCR
ncbi:MAG: 2-dehydropantoate 2-reductase [Syntrophobacterales bacterium]|nr:2-dehydropantoate 2-reductase [Syntrophobacterales bacterium]